ncbi:hypothetical protein HQ585_19520 [candidate division KSB1 bacterium]|nr:hypothetical protein [candidate division KSB1 bacterium]
MNEKEILVAFIDDLFIKGNTSVISLNPSDIRDVVKAINKFNLDFDDAYQYIAAEKYSFELISYDSDYDRTLRGRKTPEDFF